MSRAVADKEAKQSPDRLWKINDEKAQKNGRCHAVYWVKEKPITEDEQLHISLDAKRSWKEGDAYRGEWKDNKKHGFGIKLWANGNKYEGDWQRGLRHGHGTYWVKENGKSEPRKIYTGNFIKGLKSGTGVYYYADGSRYEGNWKNDMRQEQGTLFFANGNTYVGNWHEDKQCGFGTLNFASEDVYEGQWLNGKREGPGIMYFKSKQKIYDGEWQQDIPRCGVYIDAAEFFDTNPEQDEDGTPRGPMLRNKRMPIPRLRLAAPDDVLAASIERIQTERQAVRALPFADLESLFSEGVLDNLRRIFSQADTDGEGRIRSGSLRALLREVGHNINEVQLAQLLIDIDKEVADAVSFADFVKAAHLVEQRMGAAGQGEGILTDFY